MGTQQHGGRPPYGAPREERASVALAGKDESIKKWVRNEIDKDTVTFADVFGKELKEGELTTSQIRIVFGEMRRIQLNKYVPEKTSFILLKPKLAYAVKRHNKKGLTDFYKFFSIAYDAVDTKDDENGAKHFGNMMQLMEAVLAYHKYHGGRE